MSVRNANGLIRLGVWALPLAGLIGLVSIYGVFMLGPGGIIASSDNQAVVSSGYFVSQFVGSAIALTVLIFGVMALYAYLVNTGQKALAVGALVFSIAGIALDLTEVGVYAYTVPALSRSFLDGHTQSIVIIDHIFDGPFGVIDFVDFLPYSVGLLLFGIAVWRSGVLPRWAGVLIAVHAPLISGLFSVVLSLVGVVLGLVGGGWIALSVMRNPSALREGQAEPRVR